MRQAEKEGGRDPNESNLRRHKAAPFLPPMSLVMPDRKSRLGKRARWDRSRSTDRGFADTRCDVSENAVAQTTETIRQSN